MTIAIIILLVLIIAETLYIAKIKLTPQKETEEETKAREEKAREEAEEKQRVEEILKEYKRVFNYGEADALGRNKE